MALLSHFPDLRVVAEAGNGREATELYFRHRPDITLMDLRMPEMDGVEVMSRARRLCPGLLIIVLTGHATLESAIAAVKSDAVDFMKATTELSAMGTWQDPKGAANDLRADNILLQIEYGEIEGELIGDGVVIALGLINNLEINEEILYGRMENIEQSTLIV